MIIRHDKLVFNISPIDELMFWFEANQYKILSLLLHLSKTLPTPMNEADYRMEISGYFCKNLERILGRLKDEASKGYDMLYCSPVVDNPLRLSVKISMEIFQRPKKRGESLTKPKDLILTNALGRVINSADAPERNFDALLAVQRGHKVNDFVTKFGVATYDTVRNAILSRNCSKGDQIKFSLEDTEWDFLSEPLVDGSNPDERRAIQDLLDEEFRKDKEECYKKYCSIVPITFLPEQD